MLMSKVCEEESNAKTITIYHKQGEFAAGRKWYHGTSFVLLTPHKASNFLIFVCPFGSK